MTNSTKKRLLAFLFIYMNASIVCADAQNDIPQYIKDHKNEHIILASRFGDANSIKNLIDMGADVNARWKWTIKKGMTPLHAAIFQNKQDVVGILLQHGADVSICGPWDDTPLHAAASTGNKEIVKMLLRAGAVVNVEDVHEYSPLWYATIAGHKSIVSLLLKEGAKIKDEIKDAVLDNMISAVKILLDCGVSVHHQDGLGWTPLHCAFSREMAEILYNAGANINYKSSDNYNRTPLHEATVSGNTKVVQFLVEKRAQVDAVDTWGHTALHDAAERNGVDIIRILLEGGADFTLKTNAGETALDLAMYGDYDEVVSVLREFGAV